MELLGEDPDHGARLGRLKVFLSGTRGAAHDWEERYAGDLTEVGFRASPCSFTHEEHGLKKAVHGDDLLTAVPRKHTMWIKSVMDERFEAKHKLMGPGETDTKDMEVLNCQVCWRRWHPLRGG